MDDYFRLTETNFMKYASMIPQWLIESWKDGTDTEFWGMESYGEPVGAAVLKREGSDKILQYLYIEKNSREAGRGKNFLMELLYQAYQEGCERFVTSYMPERDKEFERLLQTYPFEREEEIVGSFACTLGNVMQLPGLQGSYGSIRALSECSEESLWPFYRSLIEAGEELVELPLRKQDYLAEFSAVVLEEGKPAGMLLVQREGENRLRIPFMVNLSRNITAPVGMIRFALQAARSVCPPETVCHFAVVNGTLMQLLEKLGINEFTKRQRCVMKLSYFEMYHQKVDQKMDQVELEWKMRRVE